MIQGCAIAFLVSVFVAGVVQLLFGDAEITITTTVEFGKPPWLCLCCDDEVSGAGASDNTDVSLPIAFEAGCACVDFTEFHKDSEYGAKIGVMCQEDLDVHLRTKMEQDSPMKNVTGLSHVHAGWVHLRLTKKQVGWDFMYTQSFEDEYSAVQGLGNQQTFRGPEFFQGESWVWNGQTRLDGRSVMLWLKFEPAPIVRFAKAGFLQGLLKLASLMGGLMGIFNAAWASMFVKKNAEHIFTKVYNERTLVFTKLMGAGPPIPLEGSKLPPPPGLGPRDTE